MFRRLRKLWKELKAMTTFAELILDIQTKVTALQASVAALPTTSSGSTDLTPVTTAIAAVQTTVNEIDGKLGTPPA